MSGWFVGLDIGGTKTEALVVDDTANVRGQAVGGTVTDSPEAMVTSVIATVDAALRQVNREPYHIAGVGVGVPGRVVPETGEVQLAVNLGLASYPLGPALAARLSAPVYLENDVRLAAVGAFDYLQQHKPLDSLAFLGIGTGVSAGLILDGKLYRGANGMAGEIGHVVIDDQGIVCNCGLRGCLETLVAGPAIARQAQDAGLRSGLTTTELYSLAASGHLGAQAVVKRISHTIARAVHWIIMAYDVEKVVLGGGVSSAGPMFLNPILDEIAVFHAQSDLARMMLPPETVILLPADMNPGIRGAIRMAQEALAAS